MDKEIPSLIEKIEEEMSKVVVGQKEVIRGILRAVICNGHVLVEGVPGTAKTLIIRAISQILGCEMKRIQFTVDLLPTDINGITSYNPKTGFNVIKGPIFANFVIADEVNRSPPKTQSALLEAMQENTVTIGKTTFKLPSPFFVMATENPIEISGVYNLPEAQIDRFLFKLLIKYPKFEEEVKILDNNINMKRFEDFHLKRILNAGKILEMQRGVKKVFSSKAIQDYIVQIVNETRNSDFEYAGYIAYGASPRASISLYIASKAEALLNGRDYVIPDDVKRIALDVLRHRIILNYQADAEKVNSDKIVKHILKKINAP